MAFPVGLGWGAATAAYQVEGRKRCFSNTWAEKNAGGFCIPWEEGKVNEQI
jgi:beta-glucosidase/6-phospho-beta-glucosidase/beta-galactosidase